MRIAILWTHETDYFWAAVREAAARGHDLFVHTLGVDPASPHELNGASVQYSRGEDWAALRKTLGEFDPDLLLVAGWHIAGFEAISRAWGNHATRVLILDNQWRASPKQRLGQLAFRTKYRDSFDVALVPGPRQETFSRMMGFAPERIWLGSIPCNADLFGASYKGHDRYFFTAGRLVPEKGIATLIEAYSEYRSRSSTPWDLKVAGTGPMMIPTTPGLDLLGFTTPIDLADLMHHAGAFVLASTFEPWGVVLHEAAVASRPIIATQECGAVGVMVINGVNGAVVRPGNVLELASAMLRISDASESALERMGQVSRVLGLRSTPSTWVDVLEAIRSAGAVKHTHD